MIISKYYPSLSPISFRWSLEFKFRPETAYPEVYGSFFSPFMNFPRQCLELSHDASHHIHSSSLFTNHPIDPHYSIYNLNNL
jgi:hypothetical protein